MTRRQQIAVQALLRFNEFAASRLPDFTHQPPTKVDLKFADARERLARAITDLGGRQSKLNPIFRRIYKGNHEVLATCKSASNVQRTARPAVPVTTPPPPYTIEMRSPIADRRSWIADARGGGFQPPSLRSGSDDTRICL